MDESIRKYLHIALIITALTFSYAAVSYVNSFKDSAGLGAPSFSVSGEGTVVVVPDIAQFTFGVLTEGGSNLSDLQSENATRINRVIDFLKSNGINEEDIKTQRLNITPRYQYSNCFGEFRGVCPPPEIVGYTIDQSVRVKVRDLNTVGDIFAGVVDNGANTASNLLFTIDDRTLFENQALAEAIAQAREKAEALAEAGGFRIGRLLSVEAADFGPRPVFELGINDSFRSEAVAPNIEPGVEEVSVSVILRYKIR